MRTPDNAEIREILRKLEDDQPHSTDQLGSGLTSSAQTQITERILWLEGRGLVKVQGVGRAGANQVAKYAYGICITPEGHNWLKLYTTTKGRLIRVYRWCNERWREWKS